jgi:hypothetical protein
VQRLLAILRANAGPEIGPELPRRGSSHDPEEAGAAGLGAVGKARISRAVTGRSFGGFGNGGRSRITAAERRRGRFD